MKSGKVQDIKISHISTYKQWTLWKGNEENNPDSFHNSNKKEKKYLGINLTEELKDLYVGN